MTTTFDINGHPIKFRLVDDGDALCLMADSFYVLGFKPSGRVVTYADGANRLNQLRGDRDGNLVLINSRDFEEEEV